MYPHSIDDPKSLYSFEVNVQPYLEQLYHDDNEHSIDLHHLHSVNLAQSVTPTNRQRSTLIAIGQVGLN